MFATICNEHTVCASCILLLIYYLSSYLYSLFNYFPLSLYELWPAFPLLQFNSCCCLNAWISPQVSIKAYLNTRGVNTFFMWRKCGFEWSGMYLTYLNWLVESAFVDLLGHSTYTGCYGLPPNPMNNSVILLTDEVMWKHELLGEVPLPYGLICILSSLWECCSVFREANMLLRGGGEGWFYSWHPQYVLHF